MAWRAVALCALYAALPKQAGADALLALLRQRVLRGPCVRWWQALPCPLLQPPASPALPSAQPRTRSCRLRSPAGHRRLQTRSPECVSLSTVSSATARRTHMRTRTCTRTHTHTGTYTDRVPRPFVLPHSHLRARTSTQMHLHPPSRWAARSPFKLLPSPL